MGTDDPRPVGCHGCRDGRIFEFTENEQLDPDHVRGIIDACRALGFATTLDDFGAGYAGLGLLADIATDLLKIDMALIRGIERDLRPAGT